MKVAHIILAIGLLVVACFSTPVSKTSIEPKATNYRLETTLEPINYKLQLTPYLEAIGTEKKEGTFDGEVVISFKATVDGITEIKLHRHSSLEITKQSLSTEDVPDIPLTIGGYVEETEFYTLKVAAALDTSKIYLLKFEFKGVLQNNMKGFYLSTYTENGNEVKIATTQFQPTHARKAFPCFDEPHLKATFDITIIHDSGYSSISNMKKASRYPTTNPANFVADVYKQTPEMSTYLIAFIVSKFDTVDETDEEFNVWARPNAITQGKYSYDVGKKILKEFDNFLGYKYNDMHVGGMKMDMAALPDFSAGAMENWGLLTFRETALLYDEQDSTLSAKQRVATVVAHEQAHMWFGDLVTCSWWEHTWLNEGFARYFQYYATDKVETTWELKEQFVTEQLQEVFAVDALDTSKPLSNPEVGSPASISAHFGTISYNKGASVIRMMEHMVGETVFMNSLQEYLKKYAFKPVIPDNLFESVQEKVPQTENLDVSVIMKSWTEHPGYPVLQVTLKDNKIKVTQKRFLLKASSTAQSHKWYIPLSYTTKSVANGFESTKPKTIFKPDETQIEIDLTEEDWIIFNLRATGYYRVHYDETLLQRIVEALNKEDHSGIPALNRAQIVDDALNLARSDQKYLDYEAALGTLDYIENDKSYYPWNSAFKGLSFIRRRMTEDKHVKLFGLYVLDLLEKIYDSLGFNARPADSHIDILNRAQVLSWACSLELEDCVTKSKEEFKKWRDDPTYKVPINIRSVVYCTAIRHGSKEDWTALYDKFKNENVAAEQVLILTSLGCSRDEEILNQYLQYSLDNTDIRKQDAASVFSAVYNGNQENVPVAFQFLLDHGDKIPESYGAMNALSSAITGIAARLQTEEQINELEKFVQNSNNLEDGKEVADQAILAARADLRWTQKNAEDIAKYFDHKINSGPVLSASFLLCSLSALALWVVQRV